MKALNSLFIPEFKEFVTTPYNDTCPIIDSTRLIVEILWGIQKAPGEFSESTFSSKMILDGDIALVIRYKREKDEKYRPVCAISFNESEEGIHIKQIQWSNDKSVAFRFHSSFKSTEFLLKLIEKSFIEKWIPVTVEQFPKWLEDASYASRASQRYANFRMWIEWLKRKYKEKNHST